MHDPTPTLSGNTDAIETLIDQAWSVHDHARARRIPTEVTDSVVHAVAVIGWYAS